MIVSKFLYYTDMNYGINNKYGRQISISFFIITSMRVKFPKLFDLTKITCFKLKIIIGSCIYNYREKCITQRPLRTQYQEGGRGCGIVSLTVSRSIGTHESQKPSRSRRLTRRTRTSRRSNKETFTSAPEKEEKDTEGEVDARRGERRATTSKNKRARTRLLQNG